MQGKLRITDDGREQVIKLVSDDRGNGADGGEPLRFGQLFAQILELLLHRKKLSGKRIIGNYDGRLGFAHVTESIGGDVGWA